jgi:3-dehydroquinate dehydratase/shikimate dehydrogenase
VTGSEKTAAALAARIAATPETLHEARLDLLERTDEPALALLSSPRVIATCRGREEGGGFTGSQTERQEILLRALARGPGFLDVEASTVREFRDRLGSSAAGRTKIILSFHGADLARAAELANEPGDVLKVAVPVADAAELLPIRRLLAKETRPVVRIGMGDAGLLSRVLYSRFGSPWTYLAAEGTEPTAPGQISLSRAKALRAGEERLTPLGVIGGPQVLTSNGQRVYNRLFAARGLPFHYLPVVSERPEILSLLEELGFAGVAVTMPAKVTLMAHVHELDAAAREVGALNTVVLRDGRRLGRNTDLPAVRSLFTEGEGRAALVLGAGGAARAAVCALRALGWRVTVCARTKARLAPFQALGARTVDWDERGGEPFDLLVNATPIGSDGKSDPLPPGVPLVGREVLDMVAARQPTPLVLRAQAAGAHATPGTEMWLRQGTLQMKAIAGLELTVEQIREFLNG